jgi:hypothetical protein
MDATFPLFTPHPIGIQLESGYDDSGWHTQAPIHVCKDPLKIFPKTQLPSKLGLENSFFASKTEWSKKGVNY